MTDERRHRLFEEGRPTALWLARQFYLPGGEPDDVRQVALIALWEATASYDPAKWPFLSFVRTVVTRRLKDAIRMGNGQKHKPMNERASNHVHDDDDDGDLDLIDTLTDHRDAYTAMIGRLELHELTVAFAELTPLEHAGMVRAVNGVPCVGDKRVDNAIQRARRKLRDRIAA